MGKKNEAYNQWLKAQKRGYQGSFEEYLQYYEGQQIAGETQLKKDYTTWDAIARDVYGDPRMAMLLQAANPSLTKFTRGSSITLPPKYKNPYVSYDWMAKERGQWDPNTYQPTAEFWASQPAVQQYQEAVAAGDMATANRIAYFLPSRYRQMLTTTGGAGAPAGTTGGTTGGTTPNVNLMDPYQLPAVQGPNPQYGLPYAGYLRYINQQQGMRDRYNAYRGVQPPPTIPGADAGYQTLLPEQQDRNLEGIYDMMTGERGAPLVPVQQGYASQVDQYDMALDDIMLKYNITGTPEEILGILGTVTLQEKDFLYAYLISLGY